MKSIIFFVTINAYQVSNELAFDINIYIYTLSGQKYSYTTKHPCTDCVIYRLNIQLGAKMGIETHRYQKIIVLALIL